ncbi:Two-component system, OmpR family, sensor histidine kinase BasS [Glaciecola sp. KUL10]|nr:Two-component system, OmpR family, sensor histidine kinase BasS [Glaciecola sp. KUL10]
MYTLEDNFIERTVHQEAQFLKASFESTGQWPKPRVDNMQLLFSEKDLPDDFRDTAIEEPHRKEFFGRQNRHYHLYRFSQFPDVFLVAEVSEQLLVRPSRGGTIQFLVISGLLVTIVACLIAWMIGRHTTRPLNQLVELVDSVALDSLPKAFADGFPNNEVGMLAQVLENALKRIADAVERERSFTMDVSHELRTPLAVIKNAVEVLQVERDKPSGSHQEHLTLDRILHAGEQMEQTVQTLLMLAREEHSSEYSEPTDLMALIERSVIDNRLLLSNKPIEVYIDDSCAVSVFTEPNVLKVVLDNLISNAFKYVEIGTVSFSFVNNALSIADTGPGIQTNLLESVTERGVKGDQSTGLGFGLSIVNRLCEHQGWGLSVNSGEGTTVSLLFSS